MTKGMAARAGFFSEFLGSNHKGNGGIRRRRGPCRPLNERQAPAARWGGATGPLFFSRDFVVNLKKKLHLSPVAPIGRPGYIFEIFQNGHIFLKFYFF